MLAIGKQPDAGIMSALEGTGQPWSKPVKPVQAALARVADCNPLRVARMDFVALMAGFLRMAHELDDSLTIPDHQAGSSGNFVVSAGIRGSAWRAGWSLDLLGVAKFYKALRPQ